MVNGTINNKAQKREILPKLWCQKCSANNGKIAIDNKIPTGELVSGYKILGSDDKIEFFQKKDYFFLITIGFIKDSDLRFSIINKLKALKCKFATIISPLAYVSKNAKIGKGSILMHKSIVNTNSIIGQNSIINTSALIEHDSIIGNNVHVSTGAIINGSCQIGSNSFIGSNCVIVQNTILNEKAFVKAGSVKNNG